VEASPRPSSPVTLLTFGHGTATEDELAALIRGAGIRLVVDVRTVPRSRRLPYVWGERMEHWVPEKAACAYRWEPALGGFRKGRPDSPNVALRHASFRAYADYMENPAFGKALTDLLREAARMPAAIMCSETLWWRCHRRLIADAATLVHGARVFHLMHDGSLQPHRPTPGVRLTPEGILRYDLPPQPSEQST
jgi:uncharacterized protein (DUF488 family)